MIKAVPIPLASGKTGWLHAGPTREMPEGYRLIRCAEEIPVAVEDVAYDLGAKDFEILPKDAVMFSLPDILSDLEDGRPLFVGCMGGTGRTGTLLAILVAQHPAFTGEMAVAYIRQVYKPHAVETPEQREQVERFSELKIVSSTGMWDDRDQKPYVPDPLISLIPKRSWWKRFLFGVD